MKEETKKSGPGKEAFQQCGEHGRRHCWVLGSSARSHDDNYDTCETIVIPISLEKIMTYII